MTENAYDIPTSVRFHADRGLEALASCPLLSFIEVAGLTGMQATDFQKSTQHLDRSQTSNTFNDLSNTQLENSLLPTQSSIALLV